MSANHTHCGKTIETYCWQVMQQGRTTLISPLRQNFSLMHHFCYPQSSSQCLVDLYDQTVKPHTSPLSCRVSSTRTAWTSSSLQKRKNPPWVWALRMRSRKSKNTIRFHFPSYTFIKKDTHLTARLSSICYSRWPCVLHRSSFLIGKRSKGKEKRRDLMTRIVMMWRSSRSGTPALGAGTERVETGQNL